MGAEFLGFRFSGNRLLGIFLLFITISSQSLAGLLLTLPLFRAGQDFCNSYDPGASVSCQGRSRPLVKVAVSSRV